MLTVVRLTGRKVLAGIGVMAFASLAFAVTPPQKPGESRPEPTLNQGKKWETDEAVRSGMEAIRQAMAASQAGIDKEQLGVQDYQRLAEVIDKNLAEIVKNRKVSKEAEKAFHLVVVIDLSHSVELMRSAPKTQLQRTGALGVLQSLRHYGDYFQHVGWPVSAVKPR